jgi:hypothetical protein
MKLIYTAVPILLGLCTAAVAEDAKPLVANGEAWSYYASQGTPQGKWTTGEDAAGWKSGTTPIGYGDPGLGTVFSGEKEASMLYPVAYFRKTVQLSKAQRDKDFKMTLRCDDGCIAFVNGTEIGRARLEDGPLKPYSAENPMAGEINEFIVPKALLKERNIFAVEVHQSSRESSDMRFEAYITR